MTIAKNIFHKLLNGEFSRLCGAKLRWKSHKRHPSKLMMDGREYDSLKDIPGKSSAFHIVGAWVEGNDNDIEPIVYLNSDAKHILLNDKRLLKEVLRHELLHIETGLWDSVEFREIAKKRGINGRF